MEKNRKIKKFALIFEATEPIILDSINLVVVQEYLQFGYTEGETIAYNTQGEAVDVIFKVSTNR